MTPLLLRTADAVAVGAAAEPDIAERAAKILRQEIEAGALASVVEAERVWSASRPQRVDAEMLGHLRGEVEDVLDALLDLLQPSQPPQLVLRPAAPIARGETARMTARLANDTRRPVNVRLSCGDLLCGAGSQIDSRYVQFNPEPLHLAPAQTGAIELSLHVPADAAAGQYRAVIRTRLWPDAQALLLLSVI
jgi:hypothetical protein